MTQFVNLKLFVVLQVFEHNLLDNLIVGFILFFGFLHELSDVLFDLFFVHNYFITLIVYISLAYPR